MVYKGVESHVTRSTLDQPISEEKDSNRHRNTRVGSMFCGTLKAFSSIVRLCACPAKDEGHNAPG
jgi:hypothetical protein